MKYKITLNGKAYEVEVEKGEAIVAANRKAFDIGLEAGLK